MIKTFRQKITDRHEHIGVVLTENIQHGGIFETTFRVNCDELGTHGIDYCVDMELNISIDWQ